MKSSISRLLPAATILVFSLFSSCSKVFDHIGQHPGSVANCCRIDSLNFNLAGGNVPVKISYNAAGNPVVMLNEGPLYYGAYVNFYFRYDRYNRLTDYIIADPPTGEAYVWTRYFYPAPRVILDSSFEYAGRITDPSPPTQNLQTNERIELDNTGRAVSIWTKRSDPNPPPPPDTVAYTVSTSTIRYDSRGDAIIPGVVYDDKVNIYQTNKVWQLVFGDYSMNNPYMPATDLYQSSISSYNAYGLPHELRSPDQIRGSFLLGYAYSDMVVHYSCDPSGPPARAY